MAVIHRCRVALTGFSGAPGLNTFWALGPGEAQAGQSELDDFMEQLEVMYTALRTNLTTGTNMSNAVEVDVFDVATGNLVDRMATGNVWTVSGNSTNTSNSKATQAKFRYRTDRISNNRFVSGGIFFGPLAGNAIHTDGSIAGAFRSAVITAHDGLLDIVGDLRLAVWQQPKPGKSGTFGYVQNVGVMPVPAVLRSRRD